MPLRRTARRRALIERHPVLPQDETATLGDIVQMPEPRRDNSRLPMPGTNRTRSSGCPVARSFFFGARRIDGPVAVPKIVAGDRMAVVTFLQARTYLAGCGLSAFVPPVEDGRRPPDCLARCNGANNQELHDYPGTHCLRDRNSRDPERAQAVMHGA